MLRCFHDHVVAHWADPSDNDLKAPIHHVSLCASGHGIGAPLLLCDIVWGCVSTAPPSFQQRSRRLEQTQTHRGSSALAAKLLREFGMPGIYNEENVRAVAMALAEDAASGSALVEEVAKSFQEYNSEYNERVKIVSVDVIKSYQVQIVHGGSQI